MTTIASTEDRLSGHPISPDIRIGSKRIKLSFSPFLVVKEYLKALNARHDWHGHGWRQAATSNRQALSASQLAPSDLLYRIKL